MAYKQFSTVMTARNLRALTNVSLAKTFYKCMSSAAASQSLNVGFVGLGNMGARMANNLIKKVIAFRETEMMAIWLKTILLLTNEHWIIVIIAMQNIMNLCAINSISISYRINLNRSCLETNLFRNFLDIRIFSCCFRSYKPKNKYIVCVERCLCSLNRRTHVC